MLIRMCGRSRRSASIRFTCWFAAELLNGGPPTLELLRGRRVSLGETGTNGALLAESLMCFAGLKPAAADRAGDFQAEHLKDRDLHLMLASIRRASPENRASFSAILPDAVFQVDTLPSPIADELVRVAGYQLVPLPYATALHLDNRRDHGHAQGQAGKQSTGVGHDPGLRVRHQSAGSGRQLRNVGLRLLLVANKNTSADCGAASLAGARRRCCRALPHQSRYRQSDLRVPDPSGRRVLSPKVASR